MKPSGRFVNAAFARPDLNCFKLKLAGDRAGRLARSADAAIGLQLQYVETMPAQSRKE